MKKIVYNIVTASCLSAVGQAYAQEGRPNILYIMSDDHASQAISCYGKKPLCDVMSTPNIDRIANEGVRLNNCFATNSISTPSRAAILSGQYSQCNGVYTLNDSLNTTLPNVVKELSHAGYQTAIVGKWHLESEPSFFDYYNVLPGQGRYNDPILIEKGKWTGTDFTQAVGTVHPGHSEDVIADEAIKWLQGTNKNEPFLLMCHFKAPHRSWEPAARFKSMFANMTIPEPENLLDTYETKGSNIKNLQMMLEYMNQTDLKTPIPKGMSTEEFRHWAYQLFIKDYLRCVAGIDENVGRLLKYLDDNGLTDNTIIVYTSDQGVFVGEHGFFDKRLMYEEAIKMPFLIRYPKMIQSGKTNNDIILNVDFAPTLLDFAGLATPDYMQGRSFLPNLEGNTPADWRTSMYYRYWMHADGSHNVPAHYGIRNNRYKLIFYYDQPLGMKGAGSTPGRPAWEFYDEQNDPMEMNNLFGKPEYKEIVDQLKTELLDLKIQYKDEDSKYPQMKSVIDKYYWADENEPEPTLPEHPELEPQDVWFDVDFSSDEWLNAFKSAKQVDLSTINPGNAWNNTAAVSVTDAGNTFTFNVPIWRESAPVTSVCGKTFEYGIRFRAVTDPVSYIELPKTDNAGRLMLYVAHGNDAAAPNNGNITVEVGRRENASGDSDVNGAWGTTPYCAWNESWSADPKTDVRLTYDLNMDQPVALRIQRAKGTFMRVYRIVLGKYGSDLLSSIQTPSSSNDIDFKVIKGVLQLSKSPVNGKIGVYDILGRELFSRNINSDVISLGNIKQGIYIIKLTDGQNQITKKVNIL